MSVVISTLQNITLVTLQSSPAKVEFLAEVFSRLSKEEINVDMISMSPTHAAVTELSFTISDEDLIKTLKFLGEMKKEFSIKSIVSSVNCKISVYDAEMKNTHGVAAKLFTAIKSCDADIRLISTSEVEISLLVSEADYESVLDCVTDSFN